MCDTGDCFGCRYTSHAGDRSWQKTTGASIQKSEDPYQERKPESSAPHLDPWLAPLMDELEQLMRERGAKYGPGNIAEWGDLGVLVRLSDKMARLRNAYGQEFADESVDDTLMDIANYAIICLAWRRGYWPGSEK